MHNLGKYVALPLLLICSIVSVYLTARMLETQNSWTKAFADVRADNERFADNITAKRQELNQVQSQLSEASLGWGRFWNGVPATVSAQPGGSPAVAVNIGTNHGLAVRTAANDSGQDLPSPPVVHGFIDGPEGGSRYIGEFVALPQGLQPEQAVLQPTSRVRRGETGRWQGQQWRFREHIPLQFEASFAALETRLSKDEQDHDSLQRNIALQQELGKHAEEQLAIRKGELLGNQDYPELKPRPELTIGLVRAIENAEEGRNGLQIDVDRLRRLLRDETQNRAVLMDELAGLVQSLPQPSVPRISSN